MCRGVSVLARTLAFVVHVPADEVGVCPLFDRTTLAPVVYRNMGAVRAPLQFYFALVTWWAEVFGDGVCIDGPGQAAENCSEFIVEMYPVRCRRVLDVAA